MTDVRKSNLMTARDRALSWDLLKTRTTKRLLNDLLMTIKYNSRKEDKKMSQAKKGSLLPKRRKRRKAELLKNQARNILKLKTKEGRHMVKDQFPPTEGIISGNFQKIFILI